MYDLVSHIHALGAAKFVLSMVLIIVIDCWYRAKNERDS